MLDNHIDSPSCIKCFLQFDQNDPEPFWAQNVNINDRITRNLFASEKNLTQHLLYSKGKKLLLQKLLYAVTYLCPIVNSGFVRPVSRSARRWLTTSSRNLYDYSFNLISDRTGYDWTFWYIYIYWKRGKLYLYIEIWECVLNQLWSLWS